MALRKSAPREDPQQYVLKKNYKKAIEIYQQIVKASPEDANQRLRLGDVLVLDAQNGPAIEEYKQAATLFAEHGFLLKAIGVNKKIVKLDPSQADVHERLSKLYEERGLLATPAPPLARAATAAPSPSPQSGGGRMEFEFEASGEGFDVGMEPIELGDGSPPSLVPAEAAMDVSVDELGDALADLTFQEPAFDSDDLAPDADEFAPDHEAPPAARAAADSHLDLSVEALGDALQEMPSGELEPAGLDGFGFDFETTPTPEAATAPDGGEGFRKTPLFSDFTAAELVEVVREMGQDTFAKDEVVVKEGSAGDSLFVIVSGAVRVVTTMGGRQLQLAELKEGDFFGEGSLITGKPRTATIIATEDSEFLSLSRAALDQITKVHPRVRDVMLQFYQQRAEATVQTFLHSKK